jgi:hypothetical protein
MTTERDVHDYVTASVELANELALRAQLYRVPANEIHPRQNDRQPKLDEPAGLPDMPVVEPGRSNRIHGDVLARCAAGDEGAAHAAVQDEGCRAGGGSIGAGSGVDCMPGCLCGALREIDPKPSQRGRGK